MMGWVGNIKRVVKDSETYIVPMSSFPHVYAKEAVDDQVL